MRHPELFSLGVAHVDCDAFYAAVEKRDRPELRDRPVIIGGGQRGVVTTACYIARLTGVRSAMPMFKARALCPDAVIIKPEMAKYVAVSRQIRERLLSLTPLVEPLSLDEAFLDLRGADRLHKRPAAATLSRLARVVEAETGVTLSIGLAPNKFLAKIASELDKPRGFAVIGAAEAVDFLADKPASIIWGVGAAATERLARDGFRTVGDLARADPDALARRYGAMGRRLAALARGSDERRISPSERPKSVSAETTFETDSIETAFLEAQLWRLAERVSDRLKAKGLAGRVAVLKLKTNRFRVITRRRTAEGPIQLAESLFGHTRPLLTSALADAASAGQQFRLIGVGISDPEPAEHDAMEAGQIDLFDPQAARRARAERAVDQLKARFGRGVVEKGRGFIPE